jgi:hypothetical protein
MAVVTQIQIRRGTASQWTSANPVLASGEWGYETDTNKAKIGDGSTAWNSLNYIITGANGTVTSVVAGTGLTGGTITNTGTIALSTPVSVANGGTGISSFGTGVATWLGTPTSANLASAVTDETGTGALVFANTPTLVTPNIGVATATSVNGTTIPSSSTLLTTASTSSALTSFGSSPTLTTPKITLTYTAKTSAYTFVSGDEGNVFSMNNASTQAFTIPTDATFNFAIGTQFNVFWVTGAGQPTISAVTPGTTTVISTGATSATPKLRAVNSMATALKIAANSWIVTGDIS